MWGKQSLSSLAVLLAGRKGKERSEKDKQDLGWGFGEREKKKKCEAVGKSVEKLSGRNGSENQGNGVLVFVYYARASVGGSGGYSARPRI